MAMHSLSKYRVVEQMTDELAARRRARASCRAAYVALARAIVLHEERQEQLVPQAPGGPWFDGQSAEAA